MDNTCSASVSHLLCQSRESAEAFRFFFFFAIKTLKYSWWSCITLWLQGTSCSLKISEQWIMQQLAGSFQKCSFASSWLSVASAGRLSMSCLKSVLPHWGLTGFTLTDEAHNMDYMVSPPPFFIFIKPNSCFCSRTQFQTFLGLFHHFSEVFSLYTQD